MNSHTNITHNGHNSAHDAQQTSYKTRRTAHEIRHRWLTLHHWPGVGPIWARYLYHRLSAIDTFKSLTTQQLDAYGLPERLITGWNNLPWANVDRDLDWHQPSDQQHILCCNDPHYPPLLAAIHDYPPVLFVHGELHWLRTPQLAIVGSRHPSPYGQEYTHYFAQALARAGLTITSGLALGIDGISHRAALTVNQGTIAVLGSGLDHIYPYRHRRLAKQISQQGCLVSAYSPSTKPHPAHFPQRNRIISGLSLGILVTEARQRSGALITADYAADQGRDIFALPGAIGNPLAYGGHQLIQHGAKLVTQLNDILTEIGSITYYTEPSVDFSSNPLHHGRSKIALDQVTRQLLAFVGYEPVTIDQVCARSKQSAAQVMSGLTRLAASGMIQRFDNYYLRVYP